MAPVDYRSEGSRKLSETQLQTKLPESALRVKTLLIMEHPTPGNVQGSEQPDLVGGIIANGRKIGIR